MQHLKPKPFLTRNELEKTKRFFKRSNNSVNNLSQVIMKCEIIEYRYPPFIEF